MSTVKANTFQSVAGGRPALTLANLVLAWVDFAGASGVINASYGVSSVTRNSTGNYTVNLTTALASTTAATPVVSNQRDTAWAANGAGGAIVATTTTLTIRTFDGAAVATDSFATRVILVGA